MQLAGPTLISKGPLDVVCDTKNVVVCSTPAGKILSTWRGGMACLFRPSSQLNSLTHVGARRCCFQGDVLAGTLAAFVAWTRSFIEEAKSSEELMPEMGMGILAGFGGCTVARRVRRIATASQDLIASLLSSQDGLVVRLSVEEAVHAGVGHGRALGDRGRDAV